LMFSCCSNGAMAPYCCSTYPLQCITTPLCSQSTKLHYGVWILDQPDQPVNKPLITKRFILVSHKVRINKNAYLICMTLSEQTTTQNSIKIHLLVSEVNHMDEYDTPCTSREEYIKSNKV
jgi:hypothetical protein